MGPSSRLCRSSLSVRSDRSVCQVSRFGPVRSVEAVGRVSRVRPFCQVVRVDGLPRVQAKRLSAVNFIQRWYELNRWNRNRGSIGLVRYLFFGTGFGQEANQFHRFQNISSSKIFSSSSSSSSSQLEQTMNEAAI